MTREPLAQALLCTAALLASSACTHDLTIHGPANGSAFSAGDTLTLDAEIRGGEQGCGGDDCGCADWWWEVAGTPLGLDQSNGTDVAYCRYTWTLPASALGPGSHVLELHADQSSYRETRESVEITVAP